MSLFSFPTAGIAAKLSKGGCDRGACWEAGSIFASRARSSAATSSSVNVSISPPAPPRAERLKESSL